MHPGTARQRALRADHPRRRHLPPLLAALLLALSGLPAQAATLRCGSALVSSGDHALVVLERCGAPASRSDLGQRQYGDAWGNFERLRIEEWVYGPRHGMYYFLRFEGERLTGITSRRRR